MGKRIIALIAGILFITGAVFAITACKKTTLLTEIQQIREGVGRWDEGAWDEAKFGD